MLDTFTVEVFVGRRLLASMDLWPSVLSLWLCMKRTLARLAASTSVTLKGLRDKAFNLVAIPPEPDAGLRKVNEIAAANQALGLYVDQATSKVVVVMPASGPGSTLTAAAFQNAGVATQVVRSRFATGEVDAAKAAIARRDWHQDAAKYTYGFQFEPKSGVITLAGNAPAAVVEPLLKANPGIIAYQHTPKAGRNSRINDSPPFAGGAVVTNNIRNGARCSTGFAVRSTSGGQFMTTAGHCFFPRSRTF